MGARMCLYYFFALRARASLIVARSWRPYSFEYLPHTRRNCGHSRACELSQLLRSAKVSLNPGAHYARARTCIFKCVLLKTEHLHAQSQQLMPPKPAKARKRSHSPPAVDYAAFEDTFGSGNFHTPREKALFLHIYDRLQTLWRDKTARDRPNLKEELNF